MAALHQPHRLGVRYATLCHDNNNEFADSTLSLSRRRWGYTNSGADRPCCRKRLYARSSMEPKLRWSARSSPARLRDGDISCKAASTTTLASAASLGDESAQSTISIGHLRSLGNCDSARTTWTSSGAGDDLVALFEKITERQSKTVALVQDERHVTYHELSTWSSCVARRLDKMSIQSGDVHGAVHVTSLRWEYSRVSRLELWCKPCATDSRTSPGRGPAHAFSRVAIAAGSFPSIAKGTNTLSPSPSCGPHTRSVDHCG